MQALLLEETEARISLQEVPKPSPKLGEALVKVRYASLNHRDQWCRQAMYPNLKYPSILGSDGAGIVEAVGSIGDINWIGKQVIINPNIAWGENPAYPSPAYTILGMSSAGTFAEYVCVATDRLHNIPAHLSLSEASTIPLAGLTAYRAVANKGEVSAGKRVLITGIGGGVSQFAMLFSLAFGAEVFVTSGDEQKLAKAQILGASFGTNYKTPQWEKSLSKQVPLGFDTIIDSSGGESFGSLAKMLALGGNMVVYGGTAGTPSPLHLPRLFFAQANIKGSTMGNDAEFIEMLHLVTQHQIKPIISSIRPFDEIVSAFDEMHAGKQFGKLVIEMNQRKVLKT